MNPQYEILANCLLPEHMLEWFDLTNVEVRPKEKKDNQEQQSEEYSPNVIHLYLDEQKRGIHAGYAKFETFPVWNLPLKHPVNIAYEAATADLNDVNMIDPFHLEAYDKIAVNYNRDIEIFPVLNALFEGIYGENPYKSPTDMGVNMVGFCISDDEVCCNASREEIIRRYYDATNKMADGADNEREVNKILMLFNQAKITTAYRRVTVAAAGVSSVSSPLMYSIIVFQSLY